MKVIVIGAGVVGLTTAYYLSKEGAEVTIVDAEKDVASVTSYGNAGQLSYSFTDALGEPKLLKKLPAIIAGLDEGIKFSLTPNIHLLSWGIKFLSECRLNRFSENSLALLKLAMKSSKLMAEFDDLLGSQLNLRKSGKLVLLSDPPSDELKHRIDRKQSIGYDIQIVAKEVARSIESSLNHWATPFHSAIYSPNDHVADANAFCKLLAEVLQQRNVEIRLNTKANSLETKHRRVTGVFTDQHHIACDAVVVAAGNQSYELLRQHNLTLPTYPVAGFSFNMPMTPQSNNTSITASEEKIVFSQMDGNIRVAGFADINHRPKRTEERIQQLKRCAMRIAPKAGQYAETYNEWLGYRCMTPDSLPIVGESALEGCYVNTGHGMFGWTLAAATGQLATEAVLKTNLQSAASPLKSAAA